MLKLNDIFFYEKWIVRIHVFIQVCHYVYTLYDYVNTLQINVRYWNKSTSNTQSNQLVVTFVKIQTREENSHLIVLFWGVLCFFKKSNNVWVLNTIQITWNFVNDKNKVFLCQRFIHRTWSIKSVWGLIRWFAEFCNFETGFEQKFVLD